MLDLIPSGTQVQVAEEQGGKGTKWAGESVLKVISPEERKQSQEVSGGPRGSGISLGKNWSGDNWGERKQQRGRLRSGTGARAGASGVGAWGVERRCARQGRGLDGKMGTSQGSSLSLAPWEVLCNEGHLLFP